MHPGFFKVSFGVFLCHGSWSTCAPHRGSPSPVTGGPPSHQPSSLGLVQLSGGAERHFRTPEEIRMHPEKWVHPGGCCCRHPMKCGGGQLIPLSAAAPERRPCPAITSWYIIQRLKFSFFFLKKTTIGTSVCKLYVPSSCGWGQRASEGCQRVPKSTLTYARHLPGTAVPGGATRPQRWQRQCPPCP